MFYTSWRLPPLAAGTVTVLGEIVDCRKAKRSGGSENQSRRNLEMARENMSALRRLFSFAIVRQNILFQFLKVTYLNYLNIKISIQIHLLGT